MLKSMIVFFITLSTLTMALAEVVTPNGTDTVDPSIEVGDLPTLNLMVTERTASQKPNSSTRPQKVYIAAQKGGPEPDYVWFTAVQAIKIPDLSNTAGTIIRFHLEAYKTDATDYYLYASVKRDNESVWNVFGAHHIKKFTITNAIEPYVYDISFADLIDKANIEDPASKVKFTISMFFFLSTVADIPAGEAAPPSTYGEKAAYYDLLFSAQVPVNRLTMVDLKKGDGRLKAVFEGGNAITEMNTDLAYKTIAILFPDNEDLVYHPKPTGNLICILILGD